MKSSLYLSGSITNSEHIYISFSPNLPWLCTMVCYKSLPTLGSSLSKGRVHASFFIISPLFLALNCAWRLLTWTSIRLKAKKNDSHCPTGLEGFLEKCCICISKGKINWQYIASPEWYPLIICLWVHSHSSLGKYFKISKEIQYLRYKDVFKKQGLKICLTCVGGKVTFKWWVLSLIWKVRKLLICLQGESLRNKECGLSSKGFSYILSWSPGSTCGNWWC